MKVLVIDNYDSFTYNLVHLLGELKIKCDVRRNDKLDLKEVKKYSKILLSPGPGIPSEAGIMMDIIKEYSPTKSILGICLGHQGIAECFGAKLINMKTVLHGLAMPFEVVSKKETLFRNTPKKFFVGHYHSWMVQKKGFPSCLEITGESKNGMIMSFAHKKFDVKGLQFHPESVLTYHGKQIIQNWITL